MHLAPVFELEENVIDGNHLILVPCNVQFLLEFVDFIFKFDVQAFFYDILSYDRVQWIPQFVRNRSVYDG